MCVHNRVTVYCKQISPATLVEPAEYCEWAQCVECGEIMDILDIPEGAVETEGDVTYWNIPEWDDDL